MLINPHTFPQSTVSRGENVKKTLASTKKQLGILQGVRAVKKIVLFALETYQVVLSPDKGAWKNFRSKNSLFACPMYPTCSEYAKIVIQKRGIFLGTLLSVKRIGRCHPWQKKWIDAPD